MSDNCRTLCKNIIELQTKMEAFQNEITELQTDRRAQDTIIRHSDNLLNEVRSQYQALSTQFIEFTKQVQELKEKTKSLNVTQEQVNSLRKDFDMHLKYHDKDKERSSNRNWALWMLLIGTIVSSIAGLVITLLRG